MIVLPETDGESAYHKAESLRQLIAKKPYTNEAVSIPVTVSLGVAVLNKKDTKISFIDRADRALYSSKAAGRNRVSYEVG